MLKSREQLIRNACEQGYKPEILEKVYRLLDVFQQIMSIPFLKDRLVLKGGTALNLFYFDQLPRLSVDKVRNVGVIAPELITNDEILCEKIKLHPAINWVIKQKDKN